MSKNCPDCGAYLSDSAVFCPNCGAQLSTQPQPTPQPQPAPQPQPIPQPQPQPIPQPQPAQRPPVWQTQVVNTELILDGDGVRAKTKKKTSPAVVAIIAAAAIAVIAGIVLMILHPWSKDENGRTAQATAQENTPETPIRLYFEAFAEASSAKLKQALSSEMMGEFFSDGSDIEEELLDERETFESTYGKNAKISVTITSSTSYRGEEMADKLGYYDDISDITELRYVDFTLYVNGEVCDYFTDWEIVLENGVWKIIDD